jgi:hypothetical protein
MYVQTEAALKSFREHLAEPLAYTPPEDDSNCIVAAQVLPSDVRKRKFYLYFHADKDSNTKRSERLISAHLRYRERPSGRIPSDMNALKERGLTSEWAEQKLREMKPLLVLVEAELTLPSRERQPSLKPPIRVGSTALKSCGEEYRAEKTAINELTKYRWSETRDGTITIWLAYSRTSVESVNGCWHDEEKRCREYLQLLA